MESNGRGVQQIQLTCKHEEVVEERKGRRERKGGRNEIKEGNEKKERRIKKKGRGERVRRRKKRELHCQGTGL